jgi:putative N-acetyltransferase (TIGR04045 family)
MDVTPHISSIISVGVASEHWQRQGYFALRRKIFCQETGLFDEADADKRDFKAVPIVAWDWQMGMPDHVVGTVRIDYHGDGLWFGGRLAVDTDYRRHGHLGALLIRCAVSTAHAWGARTFHAHVLDKNVRLFRWLRWEVLQDITLHGQPHCLMRADLSRYPPDLCAPHWDPATGSLTTIHLQQNA